MKVTTDKALILSAIIIILFTISMEIMFYFCGSVPDSLIIAFFAAFGSEAGFCVLVHKISKDKEVENENSV